MTDTSNLLIPFNYLAVVRGFWFCPRCSTARHAWFVFVTVPTALAGAKGQREEEAKETAEEWELRRGSCRVEEKHCRGKRHIIIRPYSQIWSILMNTFFRHISLIMQADNGNRSWYARKYSRMYIVWVCLRILTNIISLGIAIFIFNYYPCEISSLCPSLCVSLFLSFSNWYPQEAGAKMKSSPSEIAFENGNWSPWTIWSPNEHICLGHSGNQLLEVCLLLDVPGKLTMGELRGKREVQKTKDVGLFW